jgi:hypothetical protein
LDASEKRIEKNREDIDKNRKEIKYNDAKIDKLKVEIKEGSKSKLYYIKK